ncbi:putative histidine kinase sensor domain protein [Symmachiella macrocystis]|uniref:Putative histidine kinase sensor domain protein n=1 Tax=Symmachiella macrocystis TaxID=2527985 RepID=A0A5C6AYL1_9PLAN|nr:PocR ligand-binding domain-containing protein [Symmachiella macrocystis]TWU04212.1 putative histidine kinase sensor domain protein [Symmachiella macrocystis]
MLAAGEAFSIYACKNGLYDCASPIVLEGKHVANVFVGQILLMPLLMKHVLQPPKPLSDYRSDLLDEFEEVVLRCLEKDPAKRPLTAFDLEQSLASISLDEPWDNRRAAVWWKDSQPKNTDARFKNNDERKLNDETRFH